MKKRTFTSIFLLTLVSVLLIGLFPLQEPFAASGEASLNVSLTTTPNTVTFWDYIVITATVTADGSPVSNAQVTFGDTFGSQFIGNPTVNTNSNGQALINMQFAYGYTDYMPDGGTDTITAYASDSYSLGSGSTNVNVLPYSNTQLLITPVVATSVINTVPCGGSTEVISGYVGWTNWNSAWGGCWSTGSVAGVTVTITDTAGSTFISSTLSDVNGFFITNFTLPNVQTPTTDLITCAASLSPNSPSQSTIMLMIKPCNSSDLTVAVNQFFPSITSTINNYMVIEAKVTAGGLPISGASVTFTDSLGSYYQYVSDSTIPYPAVLTNSSGIALINWQFNSGTGIDVISASASLPSFSDEGFGANIVTIIPSGINQLAITPTLQSSSTNVVSMGGGNTEVISGCVTNSGNYGGAYPVADSTVTISDTLHSDFSMNSVLTDTNGNFSASFTLPNVTSIIDDIITVSVSNPSFPDGGSSSSLYIQVTPTPIVSISPGSVTLDVGQSQTFSADASGGSGIYPSYQMVCERSIAI